MSMSLKRSAWTLCFVWLVLAGCSSSLPSESGAGLPQTTVDTTPGSTQPPPTATQPAATATVAPIPEVAPPEVSISWFGVSEEWGTFRFVATVTNPNDLALEGVVLHWEVLDSSGVIVGSHRRPLPVLDPGVEHIYVGGAGSGNLSGTPASVEIFIDNSGRPAPGATSPVLTVTEVALGPRSEFNRFEPSAVVEVPDRTIAGRNVSVAWVYFDESGRIVGAQFDSWTRIPDSLRPGTRFRVDDYVVLDSGLFTGEPAAVNVFVYEDR